MEFVAEDVVAVEFGDRVDTPSVFHGRKEWLGYYGHGAEVFEDYGREIHEWVEAGDWVIAVFFGFASKGEALEAVRSPE